MQFDPLDVKPLPPAFARRAWAEKALAISGAMYLGTGARLGPPPIVPAAFGALPNWNPDPPSAHGRRIHLSERARRHVWEYIKHSCCLLGSRCRSCVILSLLLLLLLWLLLLLLLLLLLVLLLLLLLLLLVVAVVVAPKISPKSAKIGQNGPFDPVRASEGGPLGAQKWTFFGEICADPKASLLCKPPPISSKKPKFSKKVPGTRFFYPPKIAIWGGAHEGWRGLI